MTRTQRIWWVVSLAISIILFLFLWVALFVETYASELWWPVFIQELAFIRSLPLEFLILVGFITLVIWLYIVVTSLRKNSWFADDAVRRSWSLIKKYFWKYFRIILVWTIVVQILSWIQLMISWNSYIQAWGQTVIFLVSSLLFLRLVSLSIDVDSSTDWATYTKMLSRSSKLIPVAFVSFISSILYILWFVLFIIPWIYLQIRLKFRLLFVVDKWYTVREGLNATRKLTSGHVREIFILHIYQLLLLLLWFLLFFVWLFATAPMVHISTVSFYKKLLKEKEIAIRKELDTASA